jgi:hypothetical protein
MTMTEQTETTKPKRTYKRRKRAAVAKPAAPKAEFAGLTATDCCEGCGPERCVISGIGVCAHPLKGGLQSAQMSKPDMLARYNRAKKVLARAKLDLRG